MSEGAPNIVYIQSDQHSPVVMGCAGDDVVRTPNLDRLAASGARFTAAYCASPICVPSRTALVTGRYPHETEVWTNDQVLSSAVPTYAHALGAAGYDPAQAGRMHFNGADQLHGFTRRYVGDHGPNHPGSPQGVDHGMLHGTAGPARVSLDLSGRGQSAYEVHDEYVVQSAVDFINNKGIARRSGVDDSPLCLSIGLMLPHQPFVARPADYDRYVGKVGMPPMPAEDLDACHPYIRWWRERTGIEDVPAEDVIRARTAYWALVDRMDQLIGDVLDSLESNGFMDNTLIIYTSDHGEQVGEHGLWWKQTFYENSIRVPAIVSWPGRIPGGTAIDTPIEQFDLAATMIDAAGGPALPQGHGMSVLRLIDDPENAGWKDAVFSEYCMNDSSSGSADSPNLGGADVHAKPGGVQNRMVRVGNWKLVYYHGYDDPQLFDLVDDPEELEDRANDPRCRSVREELTRRVLEHWDPDRIAGRMRVLKREQDLMVQWARNTDPPDTLRWDLRPEMDYLSRE